ncbi:hypothetical protein SU69_02295 [Thermosipho melanesiensis]|uniref:Uncharacterized protein n=2 Tax=Thermosipho melanesiensis TaxID=46541 RepID=A6LK58_THEM4|nr:hypothetical protein [Thermosipho melanesiensis]ABR30309.1 hypothetical protein Tmel_0442 [Thermosipho melanesiensis BI429]APT74823.1 hypothetical protein BW47_02400 [Thermosipho melanesiensis]OOC37431.1 hypothetical protein SU68_02305 [Thermosipho melanesiensis]OOC39793.1 hypothetical protein SU69_02295 [Thermosipho melanesiensis]OOC39898.1 hypothetical protein SU70_02290 [Thermosipho melanesiensis]
MKKGSISIILISLLVVFSIFSISIFSILKNTHDVFSNNFKKLQAEKIANNLLEFSIATVKMGIDAMSNLRDDVFSFSDTSSDVKSIKNVNWTSQTKKFINKYVDTSKATIIFSTNGYSLDFEKLSLMDLKKSFEDYLSNFSEGINTFSAIYKIKKGGKYLVYAKVKIDNISYAKIAIITSEKLNKYVYYSEEEPKFYFTSNEVIYGPLKSNAVIHTWQYAGNNKKFTVMGTLEVPGIRHYDEESRKHINYNANNNPNEVYNVFNLKGNPPIKFVNSDVRFSEIYNDYSTAVSSLCMPIEEIIDTNFGEVGIALSKDTKIESNIENGENILYIDTSDKMYIISWKIGKLPDARIQYKKNNIWKQKHIKFNGVISSEKNIILTNSNDLQNRRFLYDGNLTIFSKENIYIDARIIPYKTFSKFSTTEKDEISLDELENIKEFVLEKETSSLDLVSERDIIIKSSTHNSRINNHKIFANIYSFDGSFKVENYNLGNNNGQLFVFGSIMQKARGVVGIVGNNQPGYYKFYVHDSRALFGRIGTIATPAKKKSIMILYLENAFERG